MIGRSEEHVLLAVHRLRGEGYGHALIEHLATATGGKVSMSPGAIHTILDRLEKKKMVTSRMVAADTPSGRRERRVYEITADGVRALEAVWQASQALRDGLQPAPGRSTLWESGQ